MTAKPNQKIICLGLGRTGTTSLALALEILGFGPCYHMTTILDSGGNGLDMWSKIANGDTTTKEILHFLHDYGAVLDYPAAMYVGELYATYPRAKYILTIRDPAKWEQSMRNTIMKILPLISKSSDFQTKFRTWADTYMLGKYHQGRLYTHTQQELLDHNERVKQSIPSNQLLIYEVGEGWERLVEFLGVPKPTVPFPHVNDTKAFGEKVRKFFQGLEDIAA